MLKAERHLEKSSAYVSPRRRSKHHSDKSRQSWRQHSSAGAASETVSHSNDLNKHSSTQPLSDATQSSDNSAKDMATRQRLKTGSRKHRTSGEQSASAHLAVSNDDLVSAYSPVVDRQRHSSSASSGGPGVRSANSPSRQSIERPHGYHHIGATMSPSKRTQQWAVLSPFNNNNTDSTTRNREKGSQTTAQSPAVKNLNFLTAPTSPQKLKM